MQPKSLLVHSPAKINLGLSVLGRRPDGYHDVEMVMQQVALSDTIRFEVVRGGISLVCDGADLPTGRSNLVVAAAEALRRRAGADLGVRITLKKRIPVAAGLGGGSSNAAATLLALNRLWGLGLSREKLAEIGAELGSDVPFFLGEPTALARGRGDRLEGLPPPPNHWLVIANPGFPVSTKWAYERVGKMKLTCPDRRIRLLLLVLRNKDLKGLSRYIFNVFEEVTGAAYPEIGQVKAALIEQGALGARMSGSGPTVFGIFETQSRARTAAARLKGRGWNLFVTRPLSASPIAHLIEKKKRLVGTRRSSRTGRTGRTGAPIGSGGNAVRRKGRG